MAPSGVRTQHIKGGVNKKGSKNRIWNFSNPLFMLFGNGGPTYTFLKHLSTDKLIEDLALLYARLIDLGMEYRNDGIYLADLNEARGDNPP